MNDSYDKTSFFNEECLDLWNELKTKCLTHGIPCYFSACVKNNDKHSEYYSDGVMTGSNEIHLKEDLIAKHLLLNNGFEVVPSIRQTEEIMFLPNLDFECVK